MFFPKESSFAILLICHMQYSLTLGMSNFSIFYLVIYLNHFNTSPWFYFAANTECHLCNSMQFPTYNCLDILKNTIFTTCISEFNQCYTIIIDNEVHRGCVSGNDPYFPNINSTQQCTDPAKCEICNDSNLCNANTILECYQCEGNHECVTLNSLDPYICNLQLDQCFAYMDNSMY